VSALKTKCSILAYFPHLFGYHNTEIGKNKHYFEVFKNLVRYMSNNTLRAFAHYSQKVFGLVVGRDAKKLQYF